jgi:uncharacterized protein YqjF (DUF2071 family)
VTAWHDLLSVHEHRPYPLPDKPFSVTMSWHDLLFAHWPVDTAALRALIPTALELDLWEGRAWLGVVPFVMSQVGPPALNQLPWISAFPELNVRTYVKHRGKLGVWFFSLDAANWAAVVGARVGFHLPYFWARMKCEPAASGVHYQSRRLLGPGAEFRARYSPAGDVFHAARGGFEHWLTERYCLYSADRRGHVYRGDIHHVPWPLQAAEAELECNHMTEWTGLSLPLDRPVLHFARHLDVVAWSLSPV